MPEFEHQTLCAQTIGPPAASPRGPSLPGALTAVATSGAVGSGVCELFGKRVEVRVEVAAPEVASAELGPAATGLHATLGRPYFAAPAVSAASSASTRSK